MASTLTKSETILVVDDEVGPRESIRMILKDRYSISFADNGESALKMTREMRPDVVILDIRMPGMDGIETLRRIKEEEPKTAVLLVTGYASLDTAIQAVKLGAFDYVIKPFEARKLQSLVEDAIHKRRRERENELKLNTLMAVNAKLKDHYALTLRTLLATVDVSDEQIMDAVESGSDDFEEKLVRTEKMISLGTLTAEVAHELNNIFSGLTGYLYLIEDNLKKARSSDECFSFVETASRHLNRAINIVGNILDYSRTAGKSRETYGDLNEAALQILDLVEFQTSKKNVEINKSLARNLPKVPIDQNLLEQMALNFVMNALHAMPNGGVLTIETYAGPGDDETTIEIGDTGCGIPEEIRTKIFEPFFTTKQEQGTGLGLAISMKMIRSIGGRIDLTSMVGQGTTFSIHIPTSLPEGGAGNEMSDAPSAPRS